MAYWNAPSYPPSPGNAYGYLFNAIEPDDGGGIVQPVMEWNKYSSNRWTAASWWGNKTVGYQRSSPIDVSVGNRLKGELEWNATYSRWHIRITNLDSGGSTGFWADENFIGDTNLAVFVTLEGYNIDDNTDVPGDTTFYDMTFIDTQGSSVDITWEKNINETAKGLIPGLGVVRYSDSEVELVTSGIVPIWDAVDNTDLSWSTGGDANWFGQTLESYYDDDAAESGDISDEEDTWLETTIEGPCDVSFYWKVDSQYEHDYLRFYIDGAEQDKISGITSWAQKTYSISNGSHTLTWKYTKDSSGSNPGDCSWVDMVSITED
ncbi:MAG: hypothetical protein DIAAKJNI_00528 [Candidatus Argoarchaeum ethanivorans]|uniref:Uncharacterized protein n=1 Tax=Candidatus Argoarchaeum ethanivorans TaxID=2608793 RepID=A0A811TD86_9EURY|nr:MAG: hypothetical protein DIAAKJNI_00528 [Candidatus Argoarchaeum ethanivorans]